MRSTKLRSHDVRAVYAARRSLHGDYLTVHVRPTGAEGPARAAVVAGRRVGTAVDRNRAKRRIRALLSAHGVPAGVDVVLVAKPGAAVVPFALLERDFQRLRSRLTDRLGPTP